MNETAFVIKNPKVRTADQLIRAGRYDEVNYVINEGITKKRFPLDDQIVGEYTIVILDADCDVGSHDVLSEARTKRLLRPTYADVFLLGEQHPDEQLKGPIVFLHDPQYFWSGHSFNMVLNATRKNRIISLVSSGGWWHSGYRFAFILRQT